MKSGLYCGIRQSTMDVLVDIECRQNDFDFAEAKVTISQQTEEKDFRTELPVFRRLYSYTYALYPFVDNDHLTAYIAKLLGDVDEVSPLTPEVTDHIVRKIFNQAGVGPLPSARFPV